MSLAPLRELLLKRRGLEEAIAQDDYVRFKYKSQLRELEKLDAAIDRELSQSEPAPNAEAIAQLEAVVALLKGEAPSAPAKSPRRKSPARPALAPEAQPGP